MQKHFSPLLRRRKSAPETGYGRCFSKILRFLLEKSQFRVYICKLTNDYHNFL